MLTSPQPENIALVFAFQNVGNSLTIHYSMHITNSPVSDQICTQRCGSSPFAHHRIEILALFIDTPQYVGHLPAQQYADQVPFGSGRWQ